jgi:hypothetical protein
LSHVEKIGKMGPLNYKDRCIDAGSILVNIVIKDIKKQYYNIFSEKYIKSKQHGTLF